MTRERFWRALMVGLWLMLAALACANPLSGSLSGDQAGELEETAAGSETSEGNFSEPERPPTLTPVSEPQTQLPPQAYRNETSRFSLILPDGWIVREGQFASSIAPSQSVLQHSKITTLVIWAVITPMDDAQMQSGSIEDLSAQMMRLYFDPGPDLAVSDPVSLTIGGLPATSVDIRGFYPPTRQDVDARMVTVLGPHHRGAFFGISPLDDWENYGPTFDAIMASVEFF